jgi:hypothetical protein
MHVEFSGQPSPRPAPGRVGMPWEVLTVGMPPHSEGDAKRDRPRRGGREPGNTPPGKKQRARKVRPASGCQSSARSLLVPYALSRCGEDEAVTFEAHLLACQSCFQSLKTLDRAGNLIQQFMATESPALERVRQALGGGFVTSGGTPPRGHRSPRR